MEKTQNISFEEMFELLRKEKINPELQEISQDYLNLYLNYCHSKILTIKNDDNAVFAEPRKPLLQLNNSSKMYLELIRKRMMKIISLAISTKEDKENTPLQSKNDSYNFTKAEEELFINIQNLIEEYHIKSGYSTAKILAKISS